jgi:hypothetical protein
LVLIAILLIGAAALWWVSELYTTEAARECRALYAAARTAIDSNQVDLTIPASGRKLTEPHSCANYRSRVPQ